MQYKPSDDGFIGTNQGVCMDGWHIPSKKEWETLLFYLGAWQYYKDVRGKLKDTGTLWKQPNVGATNESGFTALPSGELFYDKKFNRWEFVQEGEGAYCWSSTFGFGTSVAWSNKDVVADFQTRSAFSVRCIKDPQKNK